MQKKTTIYISTTTLIVLLFTIYQLFTTILHDATPDGLHKSVQHITVGHELPEHSITHQALVVFADQLQKTSKGFFDVKIIPNEQAGSAEEMITQTLDGKLTFTVPPTAKLANYSATIQILDAPYLFDTISEASTKLTGQLGLEILNDLKNEGIIGLEFLPKGFKNFTVNKKLSNIGDFKNLRIRGMNSPVIRSTIESLGANFVPVGFRELNQALKDGFINGQENPISTIIDMELYKYQSHLLLSNHSMTCELIMTSANSWKKFSPKEQSLIKQALSQAQKFHLDRTKESLANNLQKLKLSKISIIDPDEIFSDQLHKHLRAHTEKLIDPSTFSEESLKLLKSEKLVSNAPHIGINYSKLGPAKASADAIKRGVLLAIDKINAKIQDSQNKFKIIELDHQGFPSKGLKNIQELSKDPRVKAVIGGMHSPVVLGEKDWVNNSDITYLIPWAAASPIISAIKDPNIFRLSVRDSYAGSKLYTRARKHSPNFALLLEETPWGKSNHKAISETHTDAENLKVKWFQWGWQIGDFVKALDGLQESKVESIIFVGNAPEGVKFLQALHKLSYYPAVVSHWGITGGNFFEQTHEILSKFKLEFITTFTLDHKSKRPETVEFVDRYENRFGSLDAPVPALFATIHAYDLTLLFHHAYQGSRLKDPQSIRNELKSIKFFPGVTKDYNYPFGGELMEALSSSDVTFGKYNHLGNIVSATTGD